MTTTEDGLADGEYRVLGTAIEKGYFAVPRRTTLGEVASKVGLTDVETSRQLRTEIERLAEESALSLRAEES
jgi:predicted DNA binding protein